LVTSGVKKPILSRRNELICYYSIANNGNVYKQIISILKLMEEAERTVWKNENGEYKDLNEKRKKSGESRHLSTPELMDILKNVRLRHYLTPKCNLECFFCSNEGLGYNTKNNLPARVDLVTKLSDIVIENTPIRGIDFGGGEPLLHPDFMKKEYVITDYVKSHPEIKFAIHTNGVLLTPSHIEKIAPSFSRIGVSVNSVNFKSWNKITNFTGKHGEKEQRQKFNQLKDNLEYLAEKSVGDKVFMKAVIIKGVNDSDEEIYDFLETSHKHGFHPKFLQFEPQFDYQRNMVVSREDFLNTLERVGCKIPEGTPRKHDEMDYCPTITFNYGKTNAKTGLHSIIGCGETGACVACTTYICIYIKPTENGEGLYIKPCSVLDTRFDLTHAIKNDDKKQVVELIRLSREYLLLAPGLGSTSWNKEDRC